jgi:hypothetical protein
MPALDHLHTFQRIGKSKRYRCIHPDCTYVINKELLYGKRADCAKCHEAFIIDSESLRRKTLWCANTQCPNLDKLRDKSLDDLLVDTNRQFLKV